MSEPSYGNKKYERYDWRNSQADENNEEKTGNKENCESDRIGNFASGKNAADKGKEKRLNEGIYAVPEALKGFQIDDKAKQTDEDNDEKNRGYGTHSIE